MGKKVKKFSILLATFKRADILKETLQSFTELRMLDCVSQVLVADNADDPETREIVESFIGKLPVKYYVEKRRGKNIAINSMISKADGNFLIFADDDIIANKDWIKEIKAGIKRWPQYSVYGGKILPYNPAIIPEEYKGFESYPYLFGIADWDIPEGEYGYDKVFGPNMIIRAHIFRKGYRFDERVGPGSGNYIAGGESDFLMRLFKDGYKCIYIPQAFIYHRIRPEQCEWKWIKGRAFRAGRALAWMERSESNIRFFNVPRYVYRGYVETLLGWAWSMLFQRRRMKEYQYEIMKFHGIFYQYWNMSEEMRKHTGGKFFVDQRVS